ncbi:hypothetical protein PG987_009854 [Apiospora arundinis]
MAANEKGALRRFLDRLAGAAEPPVLRVPATTNVGPGPNPPTCWLPLPKRPLPATGASPAPSPAPATAEAPAAVVTACLSPLPSAPVPAPLGLAKTQLGWSLRGVRLPCIPCGPIRVGAAALSSLRDDEDQDSDRAHPGEVGCRQEGCRQERGAQPLVETPVWGVASASSSHRRRRPPRAILELAGPCRPAARSFYSECGSVCRQQQQEQEQHQQKHQHQQ